MEPTIRQALFPRDREAVLDIWREFIASPSVDLSFQNNEAEFAQLPGKYAPPQGCLLLAESEAGLVGCVALRAVDARIAEMKRLYVRSAARGTGLGRRLVAAAITQARAVGYQEIRLDVLAEFAEAQALYATFGFVPAPPVSFNPVPGTRFLGLRLD